MSKGVRRGWFYDGIAIIATTFVGTAVAIAVFSTGVLSELDASFVRSDGWIGNWVLDAILLAASLTPFMLIFSVPATACALAVLHLLGRIGSVSFMVAGCLVAALLMLFIMGAGENAGLISLTAILSGTSAGYVYWCIAYRSLAEEEARA